MHKFLSGGAGYAILILIGGGLVGGIWLKYDSAIKKAERLEQEAIIKDARIKSQDGIIASNARTAARRDNAATHQNNTEDAINAVPDSQKCANSAPLITGLGIMRERASETP